MRPFSSGVPRRIDVAQPTTRPAFSPTRTEAPHSATFSAYTSPISPPHSFSMMSAPHHITSFPGSYMRQEGSPEHFPSVGELVGDVGENGDESNNASGDGITSF